MRRRHPSRALGSPTCHRTGDRRWHASLVSSPHGRCTRARPPAASLRRRARVRADRADRPTTLEPVTRHRPHRRRRRRRLRRHAAVEAPLQASVDRRRQLSDAGVSSLADLTRFDAAVSDAYNAGATGTTSPCAASCSTTATTTAATACRSTPRPRSRSTTRRASKCSRARAACRPAPARRAAWSTTSSSGRWTRRCARSARAGGEPRHLLGARRPRPAASAPTARSACASTPRHEQPRPAAARRATASASLLALAGDWRARPRHAARSRDRVEPPQSQPSQPGFSLLGNTVPAPRAIRA